MVVTQVNDNTIVTTEWVAKETTYELDFLLEQRKQIILDRLQYENYRKEELNTVNDLISLFNIGE